MLRRAALLAALCALPVGAEDLALPLSPVVGVRLVAPTDRYDHGVLGDALEWGALEVMISRCPGCNPRRPFETRVMTLPQGRVFEDVTARRADLDGDGRDEVLVVETDVNLGASLAVYDGGGKRAATAFVGTRNRWLAPAGVGDFDGDGRAEVAYVEHPHRAPVLVFVALEGDRLTEIARVPGLTNHRIGWDFIPGGVRDCGQGDEVILADAAWERVMAVRLDGRPPRDLGRYAGPASMSRAMACRD